ncbi:unnamed protein product, partial [Adineta steineri]
NQLIKRMEKAAAAAATTTN